MCGEEDGHWLKEHREVAGARRRLRGYGDIGKKAIFSLKPIVGPRTLIVGEETKLHCTGTNCASDVQVTWSVKGGGSDEWIVINQSGEEEATEPLLIGQYVEHCEKEGNNHIATLTFTPHLETHKGAKFSCKFVSGGKTKKKQFNTEAIQAKPKVQEPINITFQGSQNLDLTLNLQRFYPKDIKIKWDCGEETQQPSKEDWRENSDLTWDVTSVCSVPKGLFKDPAFRVRVTWEHESMGDPESREVSAADFPWRPQVESMTIPTLREKQEVSLKCRISGYYPDDLTVHWFRLEKRDKKESPLDTETYRQTLTDSQEQGDKTFTCHSSVIFIPTNKSDHGAEFMCRVEHPTGTVEKRSGQLHVYSPCKCNISEYFPDALTVTWTIYKVQQTDR
ncbi:hypothetical protein XELAEV_18002218mg [Xenopus laevis]|nr:hypothetical protein XELAEV_18002218mg [Xenopus laevis]